MNKYTKRLSEEWFKYGKIIIAVDYDSTVSPWHTIENKEDIRRCWKLLRQCNEIGCHIIVHTSCNNDRYEEIRETFRSHGLSLAGINQNPFELPYGHESKPYFNILLDDRAGFAEAMDILENAMMSKIGHDKLKNLADIA